MSQESVTIITEPLAITISDDTPVVTIIDNNTGLITVLDGTLKVKVSTDQPTKVIVSTGIGGGYDTDTVVAMLAERIDDASLNATLFTDISHIRDLWTRVGNQVIMITEDGTELYNAATVYTDTQITNTVVALNVVDDKADLALSNINQESDRIDLNVTHLISVDESITLAEARITVTEDSIISTVTRLDSLDGPGGDVELLQSSINQNASNISLTVSATSQNTSDIIDNGSSIQLNTDDITLYVSQLNTIQGDLNTAQIELTATSATTTVNQTTINGLDYSMTAVETMLANKWGVEISETGGGINYITGMGLFLHPSWAVDTVYVIDDYVYFYNSGVGLVYKCILGHTADTSNNPVGVDHATYWIEEIGKKSSFRVSAEEMVIYDVTNTADNPLFRIDGTALVLGENIALRSLNYGHATDPWFNFDPANGTAELRNITMTFSGSGQADVQTALNVEDGSTAGATWDSNIANQPINIIQTFYQSTAPSSDMNTGDYWIDSDDNKLYRYASSTWGEVQDDGIASAISDAADAQSTADGKVVTFVQASAPTAEGTGDLWMDTDDDNKMYRWSGSAWTAYAQEAADWAKIFGTSKPEDSATDNSNWEHISDTTKIDGGKVHVDSVITIGNNVNGDYCIIDSGDLEFYYWNGTSHELYKAVRRRVTGFAADGDIVNVGMFKSAPEIIVSPRSLECYKQTYSNQDQKFNLNATNIRQSGNDWLFDMVAQLVLSSAELTGGTASYIGADTSMAFNVWSAYAYGSEVTGQPANTRRVDAVVNISSIWGTTNFYSRGHIVEVTFQYKTTGSYIDSTTVTTDRAGGVTSPYVSNHNMSISTSVDITGVRLKIRTKYDTVGSYVGLNPGKSVAAGITASIDYLSSATISSAGEANYIAMGD